MLRVLDMVMQHAVKKRLISVNPVATANRPRGSTAHPDDQLRVLTVEQVSALAAEVGPAYELLVLFAGYEGMRAGEIGALRVHDLDLKERRVTVRESLSDVNGELFLVPPKNGRIRKLPIPKFLVEPLKQQVAGKGRDDFVFAGGQGGKRRHGNFYARHFRPAVTRLVEEEDESKRWPEELRALRFHDLRHTCASLLIREGMNLLAVSRHLGHSSIEITANRYGHLFPDEQDRLADALDAMYKRRTPPARHR